MNETFLYTPYNRFTSTSVISETANRRAIERSLKIYAPRLAVIDPVSFKYKNEHQRIALKEELLNTVNLLCDECEWLEKKKNLPLLRERGVQLARCANLLYRLESTPPVGESRSGAQVLQEPIDASSDKPAKYIALTLIAPLIAETMLGFTVEEGLENIQNTMSDANVQRLNWVWGGGFDRAILNLLPVGVGHPEHASEVFSTIAPITGYMSFVLYYLRLGINGFLLTNILFTDNWIKGTFFNPWRTDADIAKSALIYEEFQTQWEIRKFAILNDTFWATANMACFFWLVGSGTLGYLGNALTGALLLFDLTLIGWGYLEQETEHKAMLARYDEEINKLTALILTALIRADDTQSKILEEHLAVLIESRNKCECDWKYTGKNFNKDLWYAAGLVATFSLLCCFFFPPAALVPATILILGVTGAALSFALTVGYHAWKTDTEIEKLEASIAKARNEMNKLDKNLDKNIAEQKLEYDRLMENINHQQSMIEYHKKERVQQALSEALIPASAFGLLVFLPLSVGLPILIPVILLCLMSKTILEQWKPKALPLPGDEASPSPAPNM